MRSNLRVYIITQTIPDLLEIKTPWFIFEMWKYYSFDWLQVWDQTQLFLMKD